MLRRPVPLDLPVTDPDVELVPARPRLPQAATTQAFEELEGLSRNVRDGEVGHVQVLCRPSGRVGLCPGQAASEERYLVAVLVAVPRPQVTGVVPPFGAILVVGEVIAREGEPVPGQGLTKPRCQDVWSFQEPARRHER